MFELDWVFPPLVEDIESFLVKEFRGSSEIIGMIQASVSQADVVDSSNKELYEETGLDSSSESVLGSYLEWTGFEDISSSFEVLGKLLRASFVMYFNNPTKTENLLTIISYITGISKESVRFYDFPPCSLYILFVGLDPEFESLLQGYFNDIIPAGWKVHAFSSENSNYFMLGEEYGEMSESHGLADDEGNYGGQLVKNFMEL